MRIKYRFTRMLLNVLHERFKISNVPNLKKWRHANYLLLNGSIREGCEVYVVVSGTPLWD